VKLGFDESLAKRATECHPGDPQSAINYAIKARKAAAASSGSDIK
jgi:hypothetical protein